MNKKFKTNGLLTYNSFKKITGLLKEDYEGYEEMASYVGHEEALKHILEGLK